MTKERAATGATRLLSTITLVTLLVLPPVSVTAIEGAPPTAMPRGSSLPASPATTPHLKLVMQPVEDGPLVAGWRMIGRLERVLADGSTPSLDRVLMVGDRLVSVGTLCLPDYGDCIAMGWHSTDGWTWTPAPIPGDSPDIEDVTATSDGLVAVGYVGGYDDDWRGAVWSSTDGMTWVSRPAPPVSEVWEVAASGDTLVAYASDDHLWVSTDLTEWLRLREPVGQSVEHGPGGFIAYGGGGQDSVEPTTMWRSADGSTWERVDLPRAARRPNDGVSVFALDDGWVMVTESAGPIFTSRDGIAWKRERRPPRMIHGAGWVASVGDRLQAWGVIVNRDHGVWTWRQGERAAQPEIVRDGFSVPVAWDGGYLAIGRSFKDFAQSLWRLDPLAITVDREAP